LGVEIGNAYEQFNEKFLLDDDPYRRTPGIKPHVVNTSSRSQEATMFA